MLPLLPALLNLSSADIAFLIGMGLVAGALTLLLNPLTSWVAHITDSKKQNR